MKIGFIILGVVLAVLILIEAVKTSSKRSKARERATIQLTFKEMRDGNFKAVKRLNSYFELIAFKGDSYSIDTDDCYLELYINVSISGKQYKQLAISKHVLLSDLESFINIIV
jgi:hypothetical protein